MIQARLPAAAALCTVAALLAAPTPARAEKAPESAPKAPQSKRHLAPALVAPDRLRRALETPAKPKAPAAAKPSAAGTPAKGAATQGAAGPAGKPARTATVPPAERLRRGLPKPPSKGLAGTKTQAPHGNLPRAPSASRLPATRRLPAAGTSPRGLVPGGRTQAGGFAPPPGARPVSGTDRPAGGGFAPGTPAAERAAQMAAEAMRPAITGVGGPAWHAAGACVDAAVLNAPQGRTVLVLRGRNLTGRGWRVRVTHGPLRGLTRARPLDVGLEWTADRIGLRPRPGLGFEPSPGTRAAERRYVLVRLLDASGRTLARKALPTCPGRAALELVVEAPPRCRAPRLEHLVLTGTYVTPNGERKRIPARRGAALRPARVRAERLGEAHRLRAEGVVVELPRETAFARGPVTLRAVYDSDCFRGEGEVQVRGLARGGPGTLVVAEDGRPRGIPAAGGFRIAGIELDALDGRGRWTLRVRVARPQGASVWPRDLQLEVGNPLRRVVYVRVPVRGETVTVPYHLGMRPGHVPLVDGASWVRTLSVRLVRGGRVEDRTTVERSAPPALHYEWKVTRILARESGDDDWNEPSPRAEWSAGRIELEESPERIFAWHGELYVPGMRRRFVRDGETVELGPDELRLAGPMLPREGRIPLRIRIWEDDSPLRPAVWSMRVPAYVADVCFGTRPGRGGVRERTLDGVRRRSGGLDLEVTIVERCRLPVDGR